MRGVYRVLAESSYDSGGSSPHARGLRRSPDRIAASTRIIPACAGFTPATGGTSTSTSDHPRMRGVYAEPSSPTSTPTGSSPHARGLRGQGQGDIILWGIIPACAGFTPHLTRWHGVRGDHPRMRGVYVTLDAFERAERGSSPHARGLRPWWWVQQANGVDHPRMRGVYRLEVTCSALDGRIIPACAGFT